MPKTFVPKEDHPMTSRQRMLHFLRSDVLPATEYGAAPQSIPETHESQLGRQQRITANEDKEGAVDPNFRRQVDLSSNLFGRMTPAVSADQTHGKSTRLTPNDFSWTTHPETVPHTEEGQQVPTHSDRAYQQKCSSGVLNYQSPQAAEKISAFERNSLQEEQVGDVKRRSNVYYSDLFGRNTPMEMPVQDGARRPKTAPDAELRHIIHQDWADSKTELLNSHRSPRSERPSARRYDELHQARIFNQEGSTWEPREKVPAACHDNLGKLKVSPGMTCMQIHQAHLRTSVTPSEFYEEAENTKHWEVVELHLSGLPVNADDGMIRSLCQGFDLQIVKAVAEVDPVRNLCKGRAKIVVRYNPLRDSVNGLVRKLEAFNYGVAM